MEILPAPHPVYPSPHRKTQEAVLGGARRGLFKRSRPRFQENVGPIVRIEAPSALKNDRAPGFSANPLALSSWRSIALNFPSLWNYIYIDTKAFERSELIEPKRNFSVTEDVALHIFKRRVGLGSWNNLEIVIVFDSLNVYTSNALLTVIFKVSPRCRSFRMSIEIGHTDIDFPIAPFRMLQGQPPSLPNLELLSLKFGGVYSHFPHVQYLFSDAPLLTTFIWHHYNGPPTLPIVQQVSLPWKQLTTVKLPLRDCDFPVLLQLCPNLSSVDYFP
jgi:hypothetical protein